MGFEAPEIPRKEGKSSKRKADSNLETGWRRTVINFVSEGIINLMVVWLYLEKKLLTVKSVVIFKYVEPGAGVLIEGKDLMESEELIKFTAKYEEVIGLPCSFFKLFDLIKYFFFDLF